MIIEKAEGNPFYLEELTRAMLDHADVAVPEIIQGVLMARRDRLKKAPKRLLQTATVLGRAFSPPLLEAHACFHRALDEARAQQEAKALLVVYDDCPRAAHSWSSAKVHTEPPGGTLSLSCSRAMFQ